MKHTARCPKCDGRRQWVMEPFRVPGETHWPAATAGVYVQHGSIISRIRRMGTLDLYVCADCGYSELWARDLDQMREVPDQGVRLRDDRNPPDGPYR